MAYTKTSWVDGTTPINAANLNNIENGIANALPASSYTANDVLAKLKTVDGSGSALDADLLDGYQSSSFQKIADFISDLNASGYIRIPTSAGIFILQWGTSSYINFSGSGSSYSGNVSITFPIAFNNVCVKLIPAGTGNLKAYVTATGSLTKTGGIIYANSTDGTECPVQWVAIGY